MRAKVSMSQSGFTIIEVMIVLGVASLILLILLLAIPAGLRSARNHDRRHMTEIVGAALENYAISNHFNYPMSAAEMCAFIRDYVVQGSGSSVNCTPTPSWDTTQYNGITRNCVLEQINRFAICFHSMGPTSHSYTGPPDEISIILGHWCNNGGGIPITSGGAGTVPDFELRRYAVWTSLESTSSTVTYCINNS